MDSHHAASLSDVETEKKKLQCGRGKGGEARVGRPDVGACNWAGSHTAREISSRYFPNRQPHHSKKILRNFLNAWKKIWFIFKTITRKL